MRIKVLVLSLVLATLSITLSTTTLAYLTDTDESDAIFTIGNVKVQNTSINSGTCENMVKNDECIKSFAITNTGTTNAYARVRILVPESLLLENSPNNTSILSISTANDEFIKSTNPVSISGETFVEYISTWGEPLSVDSISTSRSLQITYNLDSTTSVEGENVESISLTNLGSFGIKVYTEAIQAQGFNNVEEAFANFN